MCVFYTDAKKQNELELELLQNDKLTNNYVHCVNTTLLLPSEYHQRRNVYIHRY